MQTEKPLVIVGFGSQAKAWALNLKDSKRQIKIALRKNSRSRAQVSGLGLECIDLEDKELLNYSLFLVLIPDHLQLEFFTKNHAFFSKGSHFVYAHGFSLSKDRLHEKFGEFYHSLLAPKAVASEVRFQYETKGKIGAAIYFGNEKCEKEIRDLASDLGFTALYNSHFDEECMADLFSEQSLLCSLIPYASLKSYNLLRKNGISAEIAFMECYLELRSISSAFVKLGPEAFFRLISPNALIGSEKGKEKLLGADFDRALEQILIDIKNKQFYKEVEIDSNELREKIVDFWKNEELTETFNRLKNELIV